MKGKILWKLAAGIILAAFFSAAVWMLWPAPEPVVDGKSLTHWLGGDLLVWGNDAPFVWVPSTNDYPFLMRMVEAKGSVSSEHLKEWFNERSWVKVKFRSVDAINANGFDGLMGLGAELKFAVPDLILRYDQAARGSFERVTIVTVLGVIGPPAKAGARCIIDCLANDPREESRCRAAVVLGRLRLPPDVAVPALCKSLTDSSSQVRYRAARELGKLESNAVSALPALRILSGPEAAPLDKSGFLGGSLPSQSPSHNSYMLLTNDVYAARRAILEITAAANQKGGTPAN